MDEEVASESKKLKRECKTKKKWSGELSPAL